MLEDLLGHHRFRVGIKDYEVAFGENKIAIDSAGSAFSYRRFSTGKLDAEAMIVSDDDMVVIGIFPVAPLFTPKSVARNIYLKFKSPVVLDQDSEAEVFAKMPIEIGVYRQTKGEEVLLDAFSLRRQQYALYGPPENGVVCRYVETEVGVSEDGMSPKKYEEALVKIRIRNTIDNVVKVNKVIIPMEGVILDHAHDDSWLPGHVEMTLDSAFGKDIVNVHLAGTKVKRMDRTSMANRQETLAFMMDAGY
jgi:hypothetical protein